MSDTMRRIRAYKRATETRPSTAKFQQRFLKNLVQHNKPKKAVK